MSVRTRRQRRQERQQLELRELEREADMDQIIEALRQAGVGNRRDRFKAPTFDGTDDVQLFIRQFGDVARANEWEEAAALLHLRNSLVGKAQKCGKGETVQEIQILLNAQFGLTVRQARDRLDGLCKDQKMSYQDHADEIEKLVKAGHPNLGAEDRVDMSLSSYSRSLENVSLRQHLLATNPNNLAEAVQRTEEFLQIAATTKARPKHNLCVVEGSGAEESRLGEAVATLADSLRVQQERIDQLISGQAELVTKLLSKIDQPSMAVEQASPVPMMTTRPLPVCYHCQKPGHLKKECWLLRRQQQQFQPNQFQPNRGQSGNFNSRNQMSGNGRGSQ